MSPNQLLQQRADYIFAASRRMVSSTLIVMVMAFAGAASSTVMAESPQIDQPSSPQGGVSFGNVTVGATGTQTVTIQNFSGSSMTITQVQVSGPPFSVTGLSLPVTIAPKRSLTFTAQFAPTSNGLFNGSVTLTTSTSSKVTIQLSGTGVTLFLTLTPTSLNFGNTTIGSNSALPVLVTNTGTAAVTITSASTTGSGFTLANLNLPVTLNPNQTTSFSVDFTPNMAGSFAGTASLASNATDSPTVEALSGAGVYAHSVSLSWDASTSQGVTGYDIYRGSQSGGPYTEISSSPVSGTSYTDTMVSAGQTYYYVASAVTSGRVISGYSNQATATVPSP